MKISQALEGKMVKVVLVDGSIFTGVVGDYIYPEDNNEPVGTACIILDDCDQQRHPIQINEDEIESVEIIC